MHVVSDLQRRPFKARLKMEKRMIPFNDLCTCVQLVCFLIHTVMTSLSSKRTFKNFMFMQNKFELSEILEYKTRNCTFHTVRNIYAFNGVSMTFTKDSINDVFVDHAIQMRLAVFIGAVTIFLGLLNRLAVEHNFFFFEFRNFVIRKDILSAAELLFLAYIFQIASAVTPPKKLLTDYLRHCGVRDTVYLPLMPIYSLYVFGAVGYFSYFVALCIYLWNALPKYGVMSEAEIAEYKAWLRARNAEREKSRHFIEEAKRAHARLQMLKTDEYAGSRKELPSGPSTMMLPHGATPVMMGPDGTLYYPHPYAHTMVSAAGGPQLPRQHTGLQLYYPSDYGGVGTPTSYYQGSPGSRAPPANLPRKRLVPPGVVAPPSHMLQPYPDSLYDDSPRSIGR